VTQNDCKGLIADIISSKSDTREDRAMAEHGCIHRPARCQHSRPRAGLHSHLGTHVHYERIWWWTAPWRLWAGCAPRVRLVYLRCGEAVEQGPGCSQLYPDQLAKVEARAWGGWRELRESGVEEHDREGIVGDQAGWKRMTRTIGGWHAGSSEFWLIVSRFLRMFASLHQIWFVTKGRNSNCLWLCFLGITDHHLSFSITEFA